CSINAIARCAHPFRWKNHCCPASSRSRSLRKAAPIITALVVCGRVGAGIGAELGSMKVTEQIDALEASAVDPYKLLVVTRVLACILMIPLLTILPGFCGIFMGWVPDTLAEPISLALFMRQAFERVTYSDQIGRAHV